MNQLPEPCGQTTPQQESTCQGRSKCGHAKSSWTVAGTFHLEPEMHPTLRPTIFSKDDKSEDSQYNGATRFTDNGSPLPAVSYTTSPLVRFTRATSQPLRPDERTPWFDAPAWAVNDGFCVCKGGPNEQATKG